MPLIHAKNAGGLRRRQKVTGETKATHKATCMSGREGPTKGLGKAVAGIDDTRNACHGNIAVGSPVLSHKKLDVNALGALSRLVSIDDLDGGFVVFAQRGRLQLSEAKLNEGGVETTSNFSSQNSSNEFGLARRGCGDGLGLASTRNSNKLMLCCLCDIARFSMSCQCRASSK